MKLADYHMTDADVKALTKKYMIETYERFDFVAESAKGMQGLMTGVEFDGLVGLAVKHGCYGRKLLVT